MVAPLGRRSGRKSFLYNMNRKAMSTEKYSFTTFIVGAHLFGVVGASILMVLTLDFMPPVRI